MSSVPQGWRASPAPSGVGVDLRVAGPGRSFVIATFAVLAVLAAWQVWWLPSAALALLALWCAVGDEVWHLETNRLVHRVGAAWLAYSRAYGDAVLDIQGRTSTNFNVPYYRLYAVVGSERHMLFDRRDAAELRQLAHFISLQTGWRIVTGA